MFLVGNQDVQHKRAGMGNHLGQRAAHLVLAANLPGRDAEAACDLDKVGIDRLRKLGLAAALGLGLIDGAKVGMGPVALRRSGLPTARPCPGAGC